MKPIEIALHASALVLALGGCATSPPPAAPAAAVAAGEIQGHASKHTAASLEALVAQAQVALPAAVTGGAPYFGLWRDAPAGNGTRVPVVLFMHGSSGLALKAIAEWQRWLAGLGVASVAPDSFALPDRLTYTSPIAKEVYERIHALRGSEIDATLPALRGAPWADASLLVLAGTSEGAVAVARHGGHFAARIVFSWSCEDNYFVTSPRTAIPIDQPVLNVISASDPYFSAANPWLGNPAARGHCAAALAGHKSATVVLIVGAPHTLLNLPPARHAVEGFVRDTVAR